MSADFLSTYLTPIALAIMMMGMGISLRVRDFKLLIKSPKAIFIGFLCQMVGLPLLGLFIASFFPMYEVHSAGIMILVSCAGAVISGLLTQMVKGDTALSILMTAISMVFGMITIPILINLSLGHFLQQQQYVELALLSTSLRLLFITIIPVIIGMLFRHFLPKLSLQLQPNVARVSNLLLVTIILLTMNNYLDEIVNASAVLIIPLFMLNILAMIMGYTAAYLARLDNKVAKTLIIETGLQNSATAIFIASVLLNNSLLALPAIIYTGVAFINFAIFLLILRTRYDYAQQI
jgi:BASS family bile acid:Na+ symporter